MNFSLKCITPPQIEPVTAELARLHAHIDHDLEDPVIEMWISAARRLAESFQRRAFITQTFEMSFDFFPETPIFIPRPPLQSVVSVRYFDVSNVEHTISLSEFIIDTDSSPGRICFHKGFQWPSVELRAMNSVKIRYIAGYDNLGELVPENVIHAIVLFVAFHNENRAAEIDSAPPEFYHLLAFDRMST